MIKRLFKIVLVFSLCFVICSPTYATKVSDGSVFITKSEFASKLNSLSNRLSHLENSIDSKIGNLVSSYLSRNGIWNGAKQRVLNNLGTIPSDIETQSVFSGITKSGLILVDYYIDVDYFVGVVSKSIGSKSNGTQAFGSPVSYVLNIDVGLYNLDTNADYQKYNLMYLLTGEYDTGDALKYALQLNVKPSGLFSFFVNKGDNINYRLTSTLNVRMDWWAMTREEITGNNHALSGTAITGSGSTVGNWITGSYYIIKFGIKYNEVEVW